MVRKKAMLLVFVFRTLGLIPLLAAFVVVDGVLQDTVSAFGALALLPGLLCMGAGLLRKADRLHYRRPRRPKPANTPGVREEGRAA